MNPSLFIEAGVRIALFFAALWFLVVDAALLPHVRGTDAHPINTGFVSGFLNIEGPPFGWPLALFLLARALFGIGVAVYALMPGIKVFMDADVRAINRDVFLLFLGLSSLALAAGFIVHWLYYI